MSYFFGALTFLEVAFLVAMLVYFLRWIRKRKPAYYGQTVEDHQQIEPVDADEDVPYVLTKKKRIGGITFLSVWLSFWTVGVYLAGQKWLTLSNGDQGYIFIAIWLAFAIPAWFFAAWTLFRLIRGDHVEFEFDGEGDGDGGD